MVAPSKEGAGASAPGGAKLTVVSQGTFMPELPEVETTVRGISPHILHKKITQVIIRQPKLRWQIKHDLQSDLAGQTIQHISRRGKYLLLASSNGVLIIHLGMSGSLQIVSPDIPPKKHDHFEIQFANGNALRFNDPRRFGAVVWTEENPEQHALLKKLGVEPLTKELKGKYLFDHSRKRKSSVKQFIMNHEIVVGVGNIYANEALFAAGINPKKAAGKITLEQYESLVKEIKIILKAAIKQGGTTVRNFLGGDGKPGYFVQQLKVYGCGDLPCKICKTKLKEIRLGQRSTVYCPQCQQ